MTIITVRDEFMAVDSLLICGSTTMGSAIKWMKVPDKYGGGYMSGCGGRESSWYAMKVFCDTGKLPSKPPNDNYEIIHINQKKEVFRSDYDNFYQLHDAFFAAGSGMQIAMGAMEMGATAKEAAEIACRRSIECGGNVHVLKV